MLILEREPDPAFWGSKVPPPPPPPPPRRFVIPWVHEVFYSHKVEIVDESRTFSAVRRDEKNNNNKIDG